LELYLVVEGREVHARRPDGSPLLTPEQEAMEREQEALERRRLEAEVARLRGALELAQRGGA